MDSTKRHRPGLFDGYMLGYLANPLWISCRDNPNDMDLFALLWQEKDTKRVNALISLTSRGRRLISD
jgi:hypothetical protein